MNRLLPFLSKGEGKDQESLLSNTTPNSSDKNTRKYYTKESQEVSHFQAGDHKAIRNRKDSMTDKHETQIAKRMPKRSTTLGRSIRKLLEGLYMLEGANLILISDVDQDKYMLGLHERPLTC